MREAASTPPQPRGPGPTVKVGGSFAPPLTPELLARYRELAEEAVRNRKYRQQGQLILQLADMVDKFNETPRSRERSTPHPAGIGQITKLEAAEVERIDDVVPYEEELLYYDSVFDKIEASPEDERNAHRSQQYKAKLRSVYDDAFMEGKQLSPRDLPEKPATEPSLRNAAYHLLWFARELALDREPLTTDQLPEEMFVASEMAMRQASAAELEREYEQLAQRMQKIAEAMPKAHPLRSRHFGTAQAAKAKGGE